MIIRVEQPGDLRAIRELISHAFAAAPHSSGSEAAIVEALRDADALTLSLIASDAAALIGHLAISPVRIEGVEAGWLGLGPVAVRPDVQRHGVGRALIGEALRRLQASGARGCVVLGDPAYYRRFGFEHVPQLSYAGVPSPYLQLLSFDGSLPNGIVSYHPAFDAPSCP